MIMERHAKTVLFHLNFKLVFYAVKEMIRSESILFIRYTNS